MPHAEKICDPCGATFAPPDHLTAEQAAGMRSCSHGCSSARANGFSSGPGRSNSINASDAVGTLGADGLCVCSDCNEKRNADRSDLIARVAAERGWGIATGPRPKRNLQKLAERIRRHNAENYRPTVDEYSEAV